MSIIYHPSEGVSLQVVLGCDLSSEYTKGFTVAEAQRASCQFVVAKLSDGTKGTAPYMEALDILAAAKSVGMLALGYHYVRPDVPAKVQAEMFAGQLRRAWATGMLDVEAGDAKAVDLTREIALGVDTAGSWVAFTYLPRWWWSQVGSPSLAGLPPVWASRYVTGVTGSPASIANGIKSDWWAPYGGKSPAVLQYTDRATIGRYTMDASAFRGSRAALDVLARHPGSG